jgi:hypothetical protein
VSDLLNDFFKRDLTEPEKRQLAKELSNSPESASRFALLAEEFYQGTGLPQPVWESRDWPSGHSKWWILKPLIPLGLIVTLLTFAGYKWLSQPAVPLVPAESSREQKETSIFQNQIPRANKILKPLSVKAGMPVESSGRALPIQPESGLSKLSSQESAPVPAASLPEISLPAPAPAQVEAPSAPPVGRKYQELSVIVERHTSGVAKVHVLDGQNNEIRVIYSGILPAGQKTFTWDGRTENGAVAPPGDYSIEVKSGENILRHKVRIDAATTP